MSDAPWRDALDETLQTSAADDSAILTGWVIVAEWMTPDGRRWLTSDKSENVTDWQAKGMHYEALQPDWASPDEEDD